MIDKTARTTSSSIKVNADRPRIGAGLFGIILLSIVPSLTQEKTQCALLLSPFERAERRYASL
jgi:hypothetical protein